MDQPEEPIPSQAAEPEETEETIEGDLLRQKQELKDGSRVSNFYEASHSTLPSCELQIVDVVNGQVIRQVAIKGTGHNLKEACQVFDHAATRIKYVKEKLYKEEKKK